MAATNWEQPLREKVLNAAGVAMNCMIELAENVVENVSGHAVSASDRDFMIDLVAQVRQFGEVRPQKHSN